MRSVAINLRTELTPEAPDRVLAAIKAQDGVVTAGHLSPGAAHPEIRRMSYAYVEDGVDLAAAIDALAKIPGVDSVSVPAERRLV